MRLILLFNFLSISLFTFGQDNILTAKYVRTFTSNSKIIIDTFELVSNNTNSIYRSSISSKSSQQDPYEESYDNEGTTIITINSPKGDLEHLSYFIDHAAKRLVAREMFTDANQQVEYFLVSENLKSIVWSLTSESTLIDGIPCNKAKCRFRGRDYEAWFAPSVPSKAGPWKFHGLPGLILKVREVNNHSSIHCISYRTDSGIVDIAPPGNGTPIDLQEYITMRNSSVKEFMQKLISKLPKGAEISIKPQQDNNFEIEFEFN